MELDEGVMKRYYCSRVVRRRDRVVISYLVSRGMMATGVRNGRTNKLTAYLTESGRQFLETRKKQKGLLSRFLRTSNAQF